MAYQIIAGRLCWACLNFGKSMWMQQF